MRVLGSIVYFVSIYVLLSLVQPSGAASDYRSLLLQELPRSGAINPGTTDLNGVIRHYRAVNQMPDRLALYIWKTSLEKEWRKAPIQRAFVTELKQLRNATTGTATRAISIVAVYGSDRQREELHRRVQTMMRDEGLAIPTLVDSSRKFADVIAQLDGAPRASVPELVLLNASDLKIIKRRGDNPAWAEDWLKLVDKADPEARDSRLEKLPADCRDSWFWRSIQIVDRADIVPHAPDRFQPLKEVTDTEFSGWLQAIDPAYAGKVSSTGAVITRERAFAGTVKALFGDDPLKALQTLPPPPQEVSDRATAAAPTAPELWSLALASIEGSENISPPLRPHMTLALAAGLLYDQPSLHAKWPLTRGVAAWLLAHVLVARSQETGLVVDAVDIAFEKDRRFGSNPILTRTADGKAAGIYPCSTPRSPAPIPDGRFPAVVHATASSPAEHRVGSRPLVVKALGTVGEGTRAKELIISSSDAAKVMSANERSALLDFWRVAILTGVGARLVSPAQNPTSRDTEIIVAFSVPMRPPTVNSNNVWLAEVAGGKRVPAQVSYDQRAARVILKPRRRLNPGTEYSVALGEGLLSAEGDPITVQPGLLKGQARRWQFTTEKLLRLTLLVSSVPSGTPIYLNDTVLGQGPGSFEVDVPPGPFRVRARSGEADQVIELTADSDATIDVPITPPVPAQVVMRPSATWAAVGGQVEVSFAPLDSKGGALARHQPVTVQVDVRGVAGPALDRVVVADGKGKIVLPVIKPGRIIVAAASMQSGVPVVPARLEIRGRSMPTETNSARCALVLTSASPDAAAPMLPAAKSLLESRGYSITPEDEVSQVWEVESQNPRPSEEDAAAAIDCFNLGELFVFELSRSPSSDYLISVRIWSRQPGMNWPGPSDSLQPLAVGRKATEKQLSDALARFLSPWFSRKGVGPDPAVVPAAMATAAGR